MTAKPVHWALPPGLTGPEHQTLAAVFGSLPEAAQAEMAKIARHRSFAPGDVLVAEGGTLQEVGYVLEGTLGIMRTLMDGRTHIVGLLVPTDQYGQLFNGPASFRIEALTAGEVFCFDRKPFEAILRRHPDVERHFLIEILDELDAAREWIILMGARKAVERVAAFLVILCRRKTRHIRKEGALSTRPIPVHLAIRRTDLAHYLGTRPETLSRALHRLADLEILRLLDPYHFEVLDLPGLIAQSGEGMVQDGP
jgi:CRP/FNR family transcriptional regulator